MKLPDSVIIGAAKCGTSSLSYNFTEIPGIHSTHKEFHYFEKWWTRYGRDDKQYAQRCIGSSYFVDVAPSYLLSSYVFDRMKLVIPRAKLIILLRDPITRCFSHWNMSYCKGNLRSFREAILTDKEYSLDLTSPVTLEEDREARSNIIIRGFYIDQILNVLRVWPRELIHIEIAERVKSDLKGAMRRILAFLDMKMPKGLRFTLHHVGQYDNRELSEDGVELLRRLYYPYTERLKEFLNDDLPEWYTGV